MNPVILIGGAPGAGKSTIAKQLAKHLELPWLSTDQIRRILRPTTTDEEEKYRLVWEGVSELLHGIHPWDGGIIEGSAIFPEFIERDLKDLDFVKPVFLVQTKENISRIVEERSNLPFINTKTPEQKTAKIDTTYELDERIRRTAEKLGYPCIRAHTDTTFDEVLRAVSQIKA